MIGSVLIVDDGPNVRRFLRAALAGHGHTVSEAASVAEALQEIARQPPAVVLLDLGLPDGDGLAGLYAIRPDSRVPVIVLSARGQEGDKIAALDAGADDYLTKPFGAGELMARIRVALRHSVKPWGCRPTASRGLADGLSATRTPISTPIARATRLRHLQRPSSRKRISASR